MLKSVWEDHIHVSTKIMTSDSSGTMQYLEAARRHSPINVDPGDLYWGTGNAAEAHPGVQPPLCADFWRGHLGYCIRLAGHKLGLWGREEVYQPQGSEMHADFILGRVAVDVMKGRRLGHLIPGITGDDFERGTYGSVTPGADDGPPLPGWRHLLVLWNLFKLGFTFHRKLHGIRFRTIAAWKEACSGRDSPDLDSAVSQLEHTCDVRQVEIMGWQNVIGMLSSFYVAPLSKLAYSLGSPEQAMRVISGAGDIFETTVMDDLWEVSQGYKSLDEFLAEHGYMGQNTGNLLYKSWRESPDTLEQVIKAYANTPAGDRPARRAERNALKAREALAELAARVGLPGRLRLRLYFWFCNRYLPLREIGKSAMVAHIALARIYALRAGELLVESGCIDMVEDVFYLYRKELRSLVTNPADMRREIRERQGIVEIYRLMDLPNLFRKDDLDRIWNEFNGSRGMEEKPLPAAATAVTIQGLGVSPGYAEGIARVVVDPEDVTDFDQGQILVCKMTDPSWSPLFSIAAALVVDIGGMLSHASIIARELGIPAVINTRAGTRMIREGQRIAVNGITGEVSSLEEPATAAESEADQVAEAGVVKPETLPEPAVSTFDSRAVDGFAPLGIVPLRMAADERLYGGKAAFLCRGITRELPVPDGFALSWECVDALDGDDPDRSAALETACDALTGPVAVRSSGVGEDGIEASFAGQHETVLGVRGARDILSAIKRVAASRLDEHVVAYRKEMQQADLGPRMGIVVQVLVDAMCAGVMFTRNPVTGARERVVEAAWGLGEVVVGSLVTPDHYRVDPDSGEVLEALAGYKDRIILRTDDGSYAEQACAEEYAARLCLEEEQLRRLNRLAARCEDVYDGPQDIEWAFSDGQLFLLQSRPVTTGIP